MTTKERILATLRGKPTDVLPFVPRMDIWYNANSLANTLPDKYKNATLRDMLDDLGWGYHSVIMNYSDFRTTDGDLEIALGWYDVKNLPYKFKMHNVKRTVTRNTDTGRLYVEYDTPKGKISTTVAYDDRQKKSGATARVTTERAIKSMDDYAAVAYILNNVEVIPYYDEYAHYKDEFVGDRGVAVVLAALWASPAHYLIHELMSVDTFYYELLDNPEEMEAFCDEIRPFCDKLFDAAANSPAEVVLVGANYDSSITAPSMFKQFITDDLKKQSEKLHAKGKFLLTHTDGDNTGLLEEYVKADIDIADSVCPAPMTKISLAETRRAFQGKGITIWGGIPSISVLKDSMSDKDFYKYIDQCMLDIGAGDHIIFSVADTVPPAADFERLKHIAKVCQEFGPVHI